MSVYFFRKNIQKQMWIRVSQKKKNYYLEFAIILAETMHCLKLPEIRINRDFTFSFGNDYLNISNQSRDSLFKLNCRIFIFPFR